MNTQKNRLSAAIIAMISASALAQEPPSDTELSTQNDEAIEEVVVTGSLIPRTNYDGPSPVTVINTDDMKERGFTNLTNVLRSVSQSTGAVQGEQYTNSFTPNAQEVNLRGFGPGRTLVLLNGRRLPDNPTPFNGQSNFFNYATIPLAAVDRVEIMSEGASAIYGSDAITGVVNIITMEDLDETVINLQAGTTTRGGGDSSKLQAVTGHSFDRGQLVLTAEYQEQQPIFGKDRKFLDSYLDQPEGTRYRDRALLKRDNFTNEYIDPGKEVCDDSGTGYEHSFRPGSGYYCGHDGDGEESIRNYRERWSIFASGRYQLTDRVEAFANTMYWNSTAESRGFRLFWSGNTYNEAQEYSLWQKIFTPEETGPQEAIFKESTWNLTTGLNGDFSFANRDFRWEAAYTFGTYDYESTRVRFKEELIDEWFLGSTDLFDTGVLSGNPGHSVYDLMSREQSAALTGINKPTANSQSQQMTASLVGDIFTMPTSDMPAAMAVQFEYAYQDYELNQDTRTLNQEGKGWWGLTGTEGGGDRARLALGFELSLPILDDWEVSLASRYDSYRDDSDVGGRVSSQIKTRYNITDKIALRGGWGQSFRAPDMHYLYAAESGFL